MRVCVCVYVWVCVCVQFTSNFIDPSQDVMWPISDGWPPGVQKKIQSLLQIKFLQISLFTSLRVHHCLIKNYWNLLFLVHLGFTDSKHLGGVAEQVGVIVIQVNCSEKGRARGSNLISRYLCHCRQSACTATRNSKRSQKVVKEHTWHWNNAHKLFLTPKILGVT